MTAREPVDGGTNMLASFVPLILTLVMFAAFTYKITKKKLETSSIALCSIPYFWQFSLLWIISETDKDVNERVIKLEDQNHQVHSNAEI
jgi:hypothetical protein